MVKKIEKIIKDKFLLKKMGVKVIKYYRLISKSGKVMARLQASLDAYFSRLENNQIVLEQSEKASKMTVEAALRNEQLEAAVMEANDDFAVLYFQKMTGGWFSNYEIDLVLKGTAASIRRMEVWINSQGCTLNNPKILRGAILQVRLAVHEEIWHNFEKVIQEVCQNVKIKVIVGGGVVVGQIFGPVEEVIIIRDLLINSERFYDLKVSITFT